ncbi:sensor histidine kinase [Thorsellia anophelis]|uniref:histidine kinase n=1 Tax=Thorsellia anophelis DSM 18579 TaxID=1123402 RepID=A0A1H9YQF2_9GAMM|nr:HAMP domain-containing sensor histidine kinase [Thorsellia anophelis]SES71285.1 Signal transduction histidine kinase [Thorsellia anophelis DSM 18579]
MTSTIKNFRQSSSFFMATLCSILLLSVACFVFYFISVVNSDGFLAESRAAIDAEMSRLLMLDQIDSNALKKALSMHNDTPQNTFIYGLFSKQNEVLIGNKAFWSPFLNELQQNTPTLTQYQIAQGGGADDLSFFQQLENLTLESNYLSKSVQVEEGNYLIVARNIDEFRTARWFAMTFGWVIFVITLMLILCFYIIGQFVVNKVNSISRIANEIITTGNISKRIARDRYWDDLSKLEIVLNTMLDEIESLMLGMKKVTDDIAHDLRTPLTRLRNDLEQVEPAELKEELLSEADRLLSMFNGLLRIAEVESGKKRAEFQLVDFDDIVRDAEALYAPLCDEKNISINSVIKTAKVYGDRNLLFQICINLIDNAIKFTPSGGLIEIMLSEQDGCTFLSITDSGIGIDESEINHIFKRFYRVERSRNSEGNGLGLSIVQAIVQLHKGRITVKNRAVGTRFELFFPKDKNMTCAANLPK